MLIDLHTFFFLRDDGSIGFASIPDKFNAAFLLVLFSCVLWNVGVFIVLAPRMFPNFW